MENRGEFERGTSDEVNSLSRRSFLRRSVTAVGTVAGTLAGISCTPVKTTGSVDKSNILNYNPNMGYRRLGKTGLVLSEVSLGGHFKTREGERYWMELENDEVPDDVAKNRIEVISLCADLGINYVDIGSSAECLVYGVSLKGRRDKMYVGADDFRLCPRDPARCTVDKLMFDIDECLRRFGFDYLDIWRMKADMEGLNTDQHVATMIEAFEKAHKAGKARFLGISSHRRPWLQHVIQNFPEVQVVSFPCTAKTKEKGKPPTHDNIEEVNAGFEADTTQSIFKAVRRHDVGLIAIKPFMGGSLFDSYGKDKFPVLHGGSRAEHDVARLTLQCILANQAITCTIPGLTTVHEVRNAVRASYERTLGLALSEKHRLRQTTERRWAELPAEYAWLRGWELV